MKELSQKPEGEPTKKILDLKEKLTRRLDAHYNGLALLSPGLAVAFDLTPGDPHVDPILVPSQLDRQQREEFQLMGAVKIELEMRLGQAYDSLDGVRKSLGLRSFLSRNSKQKNGHVMTTKSMESIRRADRNVQMHAQVYRRSYAALQTLQVDDARMASLRNLKAEDLRVLGTWLTDESYSSREQQDRLPWIWTMGPALPPDREGSPEADSELGEKIKEWGREGEPCTVYWRIHSEK